MWGTLYNTHESLNFSVSAAHILGGVFNFLLIFLLYIFDFVHFGKFTRVSFFYINLDRYLPTCMSCMYNALVVFDVPDRSEEFLRKSYIVPIIIHCFCVFEIAILMIMFKQGFVFHNHRIICKSYFWIYHRIISNVFRIRYLPLSYL